MLSPFSTAVSSQHGELVAGEARQGGAVAEATAQAPGQADQQLVAGLVAEAVIDPLEVVDVHQQQAERAVAAAFQAFLEGADEIVPVGQAGEVVAVGEFLDVLLGQLVLRDVFVDADVVGQLAEIVVDLRQRQLAPVRLVVLAAAAELALPAVLLGQRGTRVEQQLAEVLQRRKLGQASVTHFVGAVLGDRGEARIDVFHHAVAVDQQEGAGALFHRALEQVQGAGDIASLVVHQDLRVLVGEFPGEGDLVALPHAVLAGVFQAQHADHLAADADGGVEQGVDAQRLQVVLVEFLGAWVALGVVGVDGAPAVYRLEVGGVAAGVDALGLLVLVEVAAVDGHRFQALVVEQAPDAGARGAVGFAGGLGDQLRGFQQRVAGQVAMAGQADDQVLLGARAQQVLQVVVLGALVEVQGRLQAQVLRFQVEQLFAALGALRSLLDHQVAVQQLAAMLLEGFAELQHGQQAVGCVQLVAHLVVRALHQLLLDLLVQAVAGLGFHQAGVRRIEQCAEGSRRQPELALAGRIEEQQCPARLVQPLETQQPEPRRHG